jgi:hypothetical protein
MGKSGHLFFILVYIIWDVAIAVWFSNDGDFPVSIPRNMENGIPLVNYGCLVDTDKVSGI